MSGCTSLTEFCRWPSPESELRQKSTEHYHLMFLRANLQVLLELLQEAEALLSEEAVKALGFVFSAAKNCRACTLFELALSAASHSGYSKVRVHIPFRSYATPLLAGGLLPAGDAEFLYGAV